MTLRTTYFCILKTGGNKSGKEGGDVTDIISSGYKYINRFHIWSCKCICNNMFVANIGIQFHRVHLITAKYLINMVVAELFSLFFPLNSPNIVSNYFQDHIGYQSYPFLPKSPHNHCIIIILCPEINRSAILCAVLPRKRSQDVLSKHNMST